jgi:thiamine biosynthesis lipoprotein
MPSIADAGTRPPAEASVIRRSRALMGTVFEILVVETSGARAEAAIGAAFEEVARLEELMSEWRPDSEISRVNAAAGRAAVQVSPEILEILGEARRVSEASGGAFDASWATLRGLWSFGADHGPPPTPTEARARARLIDYRSILVDQASRTVELEKAGMAIGLGGIAKGYALDRAADILRNRGLTSFVLYAGGQVLVAGRRGDRPWRVGVQHPRSPEVYFAYFSPGDGAVSTSGDYEHSYVHEGVRYHHIIDPKTGYPAERSVAVTVIAPRGVSADAWATALFVLGPEAGMAVARRAGIEALFIDPHLHVTMTPAFRRDLTVTVPLEP